MMEDRVIISGHPRWCIDYVWGARLADIRYLGHSVDCVQVREWDFTRGPLDQASPVPDEADLMRIMGEWVAVNGEEYA